MGEHVIKLPDVGEGVAEAELVEWHVKPGDLVREDDILAAVMTDKATVEIPSPVSGKVLWLGGEVGEKLSVGSPIVRLEIAGAGAPQVEPTPKMAEPATSAPPSERPRAVAAPRLMPTPAPAQQRKSAAAPIRAAQLGAPRAEGEKPIASPAVRMRARQAGIDLRRVSGTGPAGRITHDDLERYFERGFTATATPLLAADNSVQEIKVVGLRRKIAERMAVAHARIVPITYVDEVDVTALEELRNSLNKSKRADQPKLTMLPFLMRAMVKAIREQPRMNAVYDDQAEIIRQHGGVHIGIATQTAAGLIVPVVRHTEARDIWGCAVELKRLAEAARDGTAKREELSGSTITITSLGALGGIVTTPVINHPEVAIVGVNKMQIRPVWDGANFAPRKVMNLSSSFDHRVIDGWEAATFIQRIKLLLETPATIFMEG
jgi:2-oxoisovalerate dehydrogenase E2 component (dihydrolipoyl transacylase)